MPKPPFALCLFALSSHQIACPEGDEIQVQNVAFYPGGLAFFDYFAMKIFPVQIDSERCDDGAPAPTLYQAG